MTSSEIWDVLAALLNDQATFRLVVMKNGREAVEARRCQELFSFITI
jgi:hypothetical protein